MTYQAAGRENEGALVSRQNSLKKRPNPQELLGLFHIT